MTTTLGRLHRVSVRHATPAPGSGHKEFRGSLDLLSGAIVKRIAPHGAWCAAIVNRRGLSTVRGAPSSLDRGESFNIAPGSRQPEAESPGCRNLGRAWRAVFVDRWLAAIAPCCCAERLDAVE